MKLTPYIGIAAACTGLSLKAHADSVTLIWDRAASHGSNITYEIRYGTTSGIYEKALPAGQNTTLRIDNLIPGTTYYFAAFAVNTESFLYSDPSNEVPYTVPVTLPVMSIQYDTISTARVSARAFPGMNIAIESSTTPDGPWTEITRGVVPSNGELSIVDVYTGSNQKFYRGKILLSQ
jgi:hypothetical protein